MSPDELKAKLGITDAEVHIAYNGGWFWLNVQRTDANGHRNTYSDRIDTDASQEQITAAICKFRAWEDGLKS